MEQDEDWMVEVVCSMHNHVPASYMEGHPYPGRFSEFEIQLMVDMSEQHAKPRDIFSELKKCDPNNVSTIRTIYNALLKHQNARKACKSQMQTVMSFLYDKGYFFDTRANNITNELEDIFFTHPTSIQFSRAFLNVILMDTTYQTNMYEFPILEIVGVNSTRQTFCIAFAYLNSKIESNYTWALECLRSVIHGSPEPRLIVTDRELGLRKACAKVFPDALKLLCKWHIYQSILTRCRQSIKDKRAWDAFYRMWTTVIEYANESDYVRNLAHLEEVLQKFPAMLNYLKKYGCTIQRDVCICMD